MNGLLRRLAAQATGQAWAVRSDALLPFGAERLQEPAAVAAPQPRDTPPLLATPQPSTRPAWPEPPGAAARASATADVDLDVTARGTPRAADATPPRPTTAAAAARPSGAPTGAARQPGTLPQAAAPWSPVPAPATAVAAAPATAPAHARTPRATPDAPAALLPPAHPRPPLPPDAVRAAQPAAPAALRGQTTAAQATEVHVHIGRIDVTAVREAPPPKARAREHAQPMSLDAYLARRGGGT